MIRLSRSKQAERRSQIRVMHAEMKMGYKQLAKHFGISKSSVARDLMDDDKRAEESYCSARRKEKYLKEKGRPYRDPLLARLMAVHGDRHA